MSYEGAEAIAAERYHLRLLLDTSVDGAQRGDSFVGGLPAGFGWVDYVFAAAGTLDPSPAAGVLAAHFHLSLDGTRVLNLAEWTTAQAHRDAVTTPAPRFRGQIRTFPGVTNSVAQRYLPYRHITASAA